MNCRKFSSCLQFSSWKVAAADMRNLCHFKATNFSKLSSDLHELPPSPDWMIQLFRRSLQSKISWAMLLWWDSQIFFTREGQHRQIYLNAPYSTYHVMDSFYDNGTINNQQKLLLSNFLPLLIFRNLWPKSISPFQRSRGFGCQESGNETIVSNISPYRWYHLCIVFLRLGYRYDTMHWQVHLYVFY